MGADFRFAALQFHFDASVLFSFNTYSDSSSIIAVIDSFTSGSGPTFTAKALTKANEVMKNHCYIHTL